MALVRMNNNAVLSRLQTGASTLAQNRIDLYQAIGGDSLLQLSPICQPLPSDSNASNAKVASQCSPM